MGWKPLENYGTAIADFVANGDQQIDLTVGDLVRIDEEYNGWYRGVILTEPAIAALDPSKAPGRRGIFPANYILLKGNEIDLVVNDAIQVLREWKSLLFKQFLELKSNEYKILKERMTVLLEWFHKVVSAGTTETRRKELKEKIIQKIEEGRRMMGLDMIVRTASGEPATEKNTGIVTLLHMHQELAAKDKVTTTDSKKNASDTTITKFLHKGHPPPKPSEANTLSHLLLDLKIFMCSVGETAELYFSLYNRSSDKFISEEFRVVLTAQGMPADVAAIGKLKTVFADITSRELTGSLYLVCRLLRKGKLVYESKKDKKQQAEFRRPFGCAVFLLEESILSKIGGKEGEFIIPIYSAVDENQFPVLHDLIIKKNMQAIQEVPRAKGICVGLTLFSHHGEYKQLYQEVSELKDISVTNRVGFSELILPGMNRNDLYIILDEGSFSQERKTSANNVEVTIIAKKDNGDHAKDCLFLGTGEKPKSEFRSFVYYHNNSPKWGEMFKITLPPLAYETTHLYINIRHCSASETKEKPGFAIAFLKLTNHDGSMISDGLHTLEIYKPPKTGSDGVFYLKDAGSKLSVRKGEHLKIRTILSATKLTQNSAMLSLLKWKSYTGNLESVLNQFTYVDQLDIIKFLSETFDAMFAILDAKSQSVALLVYNAIVFIIGILVDEKKRYAGFKPVIDTYIQTQFSGTMAHKHLMSCLKHYFDEIEENPTKISKLLPSLKSLEYIIKFIIASRLLFNKNQASREDVWFKKDLLDVLGAFNQLMKKKSPEFIGAQTIALKNFSLIFQDLGQIFESKELNTIVSNFIQSVQYSENLKLLNMEKLFLMQKLASNNLFDQGGQRTTLLPVLVKQIQQHINSTSQDEIIQCTSVLSVIIESLQTIDKPGPSVSELLCLIPDLLNGVNSLRMVPEHRLEIITCLLGLFYLMEPADFERYLNSRDEGSRTSFLTSTTQALRLFISTRTYPENWFVLSMFQYSTIEKMIKILGNILAKKTKSLTSNESDPEFQLFAEYFQLCIIYVSSSALALENFGETKQNMIKESHGDMRLEVSKIFNNLWMTLDRHQIHFTQRIVSPLLQLMLSNQKELKQMAVSMYFSLLVKVFKEEKSFSRVEDATIVQLDKIASEGEATTEFKDLFLANLEGQFKGSDEMSTKGRAFLNDVKQLLTLLINLRLVSEDKSKEEEKIEATLKLMEYLKQSGRKSTYIKYVHLLCDQNVAAGNFIEAGQTLLLHADLLAWSDEILPEQGDFPTETSRQRKEKLIKNAITYLDKGKLWEKAIDLSKDLRNQYETEIFDYMKLAETLQLESAMFKKITGAERFFSNYFRVGFFGKGFDPSISGKEFIYRGFELERISDFTARISAKYPSAQLLTFTESPGPEIINSPNQHIQVFAVKAASKEEMEGKERPIKKIPLQLQKYYNENDIGVFLYSRPFKKNKADKSNEFKDLFIMNTYYATADTFPTACRRSLIVSKAEFEVSPVDNALNAIKEKNKELLEIITKHDAGTKDNISPFTMVLKGVIDAAVNGGTKLYIDAFLNPAFIQKEPDKQKSVNKLREAMKEQFDIVEKGLTIHGRICPEDLGALQVSLEEVFAKMKADFQKDLGL